MFKKWLEAVENRKAVILLGGPACGKSFIIDQFRQKGFGVASLDDFFEPMLGQGTDKIYVSAKDPHMKSMYTQAAGQADSLVDQYLTEGKPFVTEKTGQYWTTTAQMKQKIESYGYTVYGIFVHCDPDLAWQRNLDRRRVLKDKDEFMDVHNKAKFNIQPSLKNAAVVGFRNLFGNNYIEINNDGSPENNQIIKDTVERIV